MSFSVISKAVGWKGGPIQVPTMEQARTAVENALKGWLGSTKQLLEWNRFCEMRLDPLGREADAKVIRVIVAGLEEARRIADEDRGPYEEVELLTWWSRRGFES